MNAVKCTAIILAAGLGKRMGSSKPKVLAEVLDIPMIRYVLKASAPLCNHQIVVIGHLGELVKDCLTDTSHISFAYQPEQLGTGHAVQCAVPELPKDVEHILVLYGDTPLVTTSTLQTLLELHLQENNDISVLAAMVPNPTGYGRMILDENGKLIEIVEEKDASEDQKKISLINSGMYCFKKDFLLSALPLLKANNAQNEIYLTDVISLGYAQKKQIGVSIAQNWKEILGVNTPEELETVSQYLMKDL